MAVEIRLEIRCRSQQLDEVKEEVELALTRLMGNPASIPSDQLTGYQTGNAQNCFFQHWCGSAEDILAQYQTFKNPPNKLTCNLYLSMRGYPDHQGNMPDYVGDELEDIKAETNDLTSFIRRFLVRKRPWYIRAKGQWNAQVRSIQFVDPFKPTGLVGKFQSWSIVIFGVSKRFVGGAPILPAVFVVAGLNNWNFLDQQILALTATGIGYFAFWLVWCIIDLVRMRGKVQFK